MVMVSAVLEVGVMVVAPHVEPSLEISHVEVAFQLPVAALRKKPLLPVPLTPTF
jgi:hypothetical protein